ncbi:TPA: AbrB/MazE/SpoVT family DNA-binding domain-containing protein [Pasteurella multocida]|uniref:antitoxin n=1 Tax=Pasteurella multocida TaxID=747 RepID=UPI00201FD744|nr:AbrB/MazE/SpoVT family DNA-binding domain-containing protein [Pasteurella multocida]MCL7827362.1 AbrB/MazE/SpoVT family DNA-binding domain-containing protein [Pasteurella multocida]HDR1435575.1 AbrB/MazE/SpoVT family DNA-binding domain-containing protein [Pasteurella multocida]HDR1793433.1 AbrB/MazE/SpoVT family DNA-binding domain-containing protein [Pasteurella multocida]HDR1868188.1 AbrB/MazE/SpoVT family DNA-binding domain-containing protein [Pasteurella multocida]HED4416815.1 AbrB/MazE/
MERIARLFRNGRNQAVRLPVEFEFDAEQVYVRKEQNGDIVLSLTSSKEASWKHLFELLPKIKGCDNFLSQEERNQTTAVRDPFSWVGE